MWFWVSLGLMIVAGLLSPLGSRLQGTSLWVGKTLVPPEAADAQPTGLQDAVNDGWPSNLALITSLLPFGAAVAGFMHRWWLCFAVFVAWTVIAQVVSRTRLVPRTVDWYLLQFVNHADRRRADYLKGGDVARAEAAEELSKGLSKVLDLYLGSGVPAPSVNEARAAPFGDESYLLRQTETGFGVVDIRYVCTLYITSLLSDVRDAWPEIREALEIWHQDHAALQETPKNEAETLLAVTAIGMRSLPEIVSAEAIPLYSEAVEDVLVELAGTEDVIPTLRRYAEIWTPTQLDETAYLDEFGRFFTARVLRESPLVEDAPDLVSGKLLLLSLGKWQEAMRSALAIES